MTALAADRKVDIIAGGESRYRVGKVAAATKVYKGGALCRNLTGYLVPAADVRGYTFVGWAQETVDNTAGIDGALEVKYLTGISAKMKNDGASPVTQAQLYGRVFIKDDQTVQAVPSNGVVAGIAESIEADGTIYVYGTPLSASFESGGEPPETITTATALSLFARTTLLQPGSALAGTLAAGRFAGQRKTIRFIGGAGTYTITAAFTTDTVATTTALFNAAADQLEIEWNGTAWQVLYNVSVTLS